MKMVMIYTACATSEECATIAQNLIDKKLAACVNILSPSQSIYRWKGNVEKSAEVPMIVKTDNQNRDEAIRVIETMHSYETPGIVCWDATSVHADYSAWMTENLKDFK